MALGRLRVWELGADDALHRLVAKAKRIEILGPKRVRVLVHDGRWLEWHGFYPTSSVATLAKVGAHVL